MTAKTKAYQTILLVSITALTYTVYQVASKTAPKNESVPVQVKSMQTVKEEKANQKKMQQTSVDLNVKSSTPGYCNPDETY